MGFIRHAVYSSVRSYNRASAASRAASYARRERDSRARTAAAMFYEPGPTRSEVLDYLAMKADAARSPERAAAYRLQAAAIRNGASYTVSANPDTGTVRVKVF